MSSHISGESFGGHRTVALAPSPVHATHFRINAAHDWDCWVVGCLLSALSLAALCLFYARDEILLSGDAVAHINIARRVLDSRTPGPLQLGSVWLPLPHVLTIPFVISIRMWQTGLGGSLVSVISYVVAGVGLFRFLSRSSRFGAWIGVVSFALNPNLVYLQTTALNEPLYLAAFVWAVLFFTNAWESLQQRPLEAGRYLARGAIALTAAIFTRYDGWFLAVVCWFAVIPALARALQGMAPADMKQVQRAILKAVLITTIGPALWIGYNLCVYGNALEFANGPYSAKAIAQRTTDKNSPPYPGQDHPWTAGLYFVKAAQLCIGEEHAAKILVWLAAMTSFLSAVRKRWFAITVLWSPLLFYSLSIAYGAVPIFIPVWWPFSYYNVRYGLELLPAIAAGIALIVFFVERLAESQTLRISVAAVVLLMVGISYVDAWRAASICLREVRANGNARLQLDERLAEILDNLPPRSTVLAYTGAHSGAFELAAFPLQQTINEGNEFAWDVSLLNPALAADYVVASDDDPVAIAVQRHSTGLIPIATLTVSGQAQIKVYKSVARKKDLEHRQQNRNETLD